MTAVIRWCVLYGFELVELQELDDADEDVAEIDEAIGFDRIIESLHATEWTHVTMAG